MNELIQIVQTNELDEQDGQIIIDRFGSYEKIAQEWELKAKMIVVTSRDQTTEMAMAKEARKKFSNMRIELEKARKAIGEPAYRKYKAVNAVAKYLQALIQPIEDHLLEQENFIKNDDARIAAEKKVEEERRIEAERLAQIEADRKEQERIRLENEKLKKEADEREAQMIKEREEARKKQEDIENRARIAKEKAEAEKRKIEEENKRKLEEARKETARVEAELQAKKDAEAKAKRDAEIAEQKRLADAEKARQEALLAPDKEKFTKYVQDLLNMPTPIIKDQRIAGKKEAIKNYLLEQLKNI